MSISAVGSAPIMPTTPERLEGPGSENDGDSDDAVQQAQAQAQTQAKAATPPGVGAIVDKMA